VGRSVNCTGSNPGWLRVQEPYGRFAIVVRWNFDRFVSLGNSIDLFPEPSPDPSSKEPFHSLATAALDSKSRIMGATPLGKEDIPTH